MGRRRADASSRRGLETFFRTPTTSFRIFDHSYHLIYIIGVSRHVVLDISRSSRACMAESEIMGDAPTDSAHKP